MTTDDFFDITGAPLPPDFEFIRRLGRGSMAEVFLARNKPLRRFVALKVLSPELASDPLSKKRFIREAQAAARISHPSVTAIYAVGTLENSTPYIEMQYVEGSNLAQVLRSRNNLEPEEVENILIQLSSALAAAHKNRIIHRDVKPANVLLESDSDRVYLTDFGVAGILETGSEAVTKLTREGDLVGDPAYMSPEQLRGEPLTEQTDIYSLGVLGYKLLTGGGPYGEASDTATASAHLRRHPFNLCEARPEIPVALSATLKQSLSKMPANRPRAEDMEILIQGRSDSRPTNELRRFLNELRQRKVYRAAATYAAVAFIVLQAFDLIFQPFNIPAWVYRLIVVASLAGFPVAIALAWVFDLREGRLIRTADSDKKMRNSRSRTVLQVCGLGISILLSASVAWWLFVRQ